MVESCTIENKIFTQFHFSQNVYDLICTFYELYFIIEDFRCNASSLAFTHFIWRGALGSIILNF